MGLGEHGFIVWVCNQGDGVIFRLLIYGSRIIAHDQCHGMVRFGLVLSVVSPMTWSWCTPVELRTSPSTSAASFSNPTEDGRLSQHMIVGHP